MTRLLLQAISISALWSIPATLLAATEGERQNPIPAPPDLISGGQLVETALALGLVLAVMLGLAWLVKRFVSVPGMGRGQIQVIGGVSLGPRERAVMISVEGKRLLLGVAPGRVQMLHVLSEAEAQSEQGFAQVLANSQDAPQVEVRGKQP